MKQNITVTCKNANKVQRKIHTLPVGTFFTHGTSSYVKIRDITVTGHARVYDLITRDVRILNQDSEVTVWTNIRITHSLETEGDCKCE